MEEKTSKQVTDKPVGVLTGNLRKQLGLRQIEVAKFLGISRPALSAYEKGKGKLRPEIEEQLFRFIEDKLAASANTGTLAWKKTGSQLQGRDCSGNRERLNISQRQLADKSGVSQSAISLFENGYSDLDIDERERLNAAFKYFVEQKPALSAQAGMLERLASGAYVEHLTTKYDWDGVTFRIAKLTGTIEGMKQAYKDDPETFAELESTQANLQEWLDAIQKSNPQPETPVSDEMLEYERKHLPKMEARVKKLTDWACSPWRDIEKLEKRVTALEEENRLLRHKAKR